MDIDIIRDICLSFPATEMEIKWKSDLVFMVGRKMFCMVDLDAVPPVVSFKVSDEDYEEKVASYGFKPAPWFGKNKWVAVTDHHMLTHADWTRYLKASYGLVRQKLTQQLRRDLGIS
ncbi:hypothetical protein HYN48_09640 [Flavobacterium magnum]|uniref:MmcQ-like protein n=1 Tax=Flavobacterium magnum TaxID=2162713 RepID=A0A2S0REF2_9FLAO|nr:MmcQ/YjbR family DNA-binding protein [Flavobacterium magnum]AWA30327.1 hypothetical protein HYN48_09640 [Flavobacterium magnum]